MARRTPDPARFRLPGPEMSPEPCACGKIPLAEWRYCHYCGAKNAGWNAKLVHVCRVCERKRAADA